MHFDWIYIFATMIVVSIATTLILGAAAYFEARRVTAVNSRRDER
ncbi:MAG TPA: hypothetical protein VMU84_18095 [Thermoanaerobaculia bacterium]|nr:hypothetical protein [Thermoanaerobaculia bacterium]